MKISIKSQKSSILWYACSEFKHSAFVTGMYNELKLPLTSSTALLNDDCKKVSRKKAD